MLPCPFLSLIIIWHLGYRERFKCLVPFETVSGYIIHTSSNSWWKIFGGGGGRASAPVALPLSTPLNMPYQ